MVVAILKGSKTVTVHYDVSSVSIEDNILNIHMKDCYVISYVTNKHLTFSIQYDIKERKILKEVK